MKKRIVHVVSNPGVSGVTAVIRFLSLGMKEKGWSVYLVHYGKSDDFCEMLSRDGAKVYKIKAPPRWIQPLRTWWIIWEMKKIFSSISPTLIHAHSFDVDLLSARASMGSHFPIVVTCHSFSYVDWVKRELRQYRKWDRRIAGFVCVCKLLEKQLFETLSPSRDRLRTIYNAPDIHFFREISEAERVECRKKFRILPDEVVITCVATYHPAKGQEVLAEAFSRLAKKHNVRLFLVGSEGRIYGGNSIKQKVSDILTSAGVLERCHMIDDCTDVRPILAASDIYVQPSHQEGLSVALGEALACALPAVVTSAGGNPEIVLDGQNGFVVPPADPEKMAMAIGKLVRDKNMRKSMGDYSMQFAEKNLHPSMIIKSYSDFYDEIAQQD